MGYPHLPDNFSHNLHFLGPNNIQIKTACFQTHCIFDKNFHMNLFKISQEMLMLECLQLEWTIRGTHR